MLYDAPSASPAVLDRLCDGLKTVLDGVGDRLPLLGLGVLQWDGPDRAVLNYVDATGITAHRLARAAVPDAVRPGISVPGRLVPGADDRRSLGVFGTRVFIEGLPASVQAALPVKQAVAVPIPTRTTPATLIMGLSTPEEPTDRQLSIIATLARDVAGWLDGTESGSDELARLRRLGTVEGVMPALISVLDIRQIFARLSDVTRDGLPHDLLSVGTFSDDLTEVYTYASVGTGIPEKAPVPYPREAIEAFLYQVLEDMPTSPVDTSAEGSEAGIRSAMRLPVRLDDTVVAVLNFSSKTPGSYGSVDLSIGRRIADYVALALSHQRLAEEGRRASALEERATNLEVLDGLLNTITGVLDIREVFDRVSEIARRVLPHDAMALPVFTEDRQHVTPFATVGVPTGSLPSKTAVPESVRYLLTEPWDTIITNDIEADPREGSNPFPNFGLRSMMRVAIRLDGELVALLIVFSKTVGAFTQADTLIGRRIADHVALALSHQRLAEETLKAAALEERAANLAMLDSLLNALTGVLDIREVFSRVSEIASRVLPHDAMGLPIFTDDREHVIPYATIGLPNDTFTRIEPIPESQRHLLTQPWDSQISADLQTMADWRDSGFARAGMRSVLRVPIRVDGELIGILGFFSRELGLYTQDDALLAKRIASHVALAVSHQRLADESKRRAALQERQANLEVLDGLLKTLTGVLDIRQVFDRVSQISQRVLPHDAVAIGEVMPGGESIRMYASQGLGAGSDPFDAPIRDRSLLTEPWDYRLMDDIREHPLYAGGSSATVGGMVSVLFVPIRLEEGRLYGGLTFYSRTRGHFTRDDVLLATRIADHIALALSHQRLAEESQRAAALQERQTNLDALDGLLSTVAGVLDVRNVFDRISSIGNTVMPHDAMTIAVLTKVPGIVRLYAATGALRDLPVPAELKIPNPRLLEESWEFELIDDIQQDPRYASAPSAKAGMRSLLTMPIRVSGELLGGVNFCSSRAGRFTRDDVPMARRITDHIALALQHERLAEEMRRSEELRSQTANLGLLDALLAAVTDTGELRHVIDRVSDIAQKVLPHDAMVVPVLLGDKANVRFHVVRAPGTKFPEVMETAPHLRNSEWEYDIADDLQADPAQRELTLAKLGYRAVLRMPIRVEGQLTAGVGFFSFTPGAYKEADVAIGRRVADRIAISLMRELGLAASKRADEAAERAARLESRVQALTDELNSRAGFHRVIGKSASWRQVLTQASQVAATETTVLLLGESGTGKEVVARFLHRASARKNGPFVALNCAALPEQLLESELFGYERGAFTGAMVSRAGKIEQAAGGVLFLDEVGEMSPAVQAKFLRVLQEREFQRLGGSKTLKADARVIAATNRDPKTAMERGQFREDLYYRLSVFEIALPPLRERRDDILLLVESFLADLAKSVGRPAAGLSEDAKDRLLAYAWPGNVRELRNAVERAVILCEGGLISSEHLPIAVGQARSAPAPPAAVASTAGPRSGNGEAAAAGSPGGLKLDDLERDLLSKAMAQARNNKSQAAKLLGVPRGQFYSLLKKHGLTDAKR
jgi:transcriptional regulator with GAF, ATPase, and Fis domain